MKTKKALFFNIFIILFLLLTLIGCPDQFNEDEDDNNEKQEQSEEKYSIVGYWQSSYGDGFEVFNGTPPTFEQYDDASKTISFAGNIVNYTDLSSVSTSGYLTILITNSGTWGKTVGEYYVVHWQNLNNTSVAESCAWKSGGQSTMPTQSQAEAEFTVANGYFAVHGDYIKQ